MTNHSANSPPLVGADKDNGSHAISTEFSPGRPGSGVAVALKTEDLSQKFLLSKSHNLRTNTEPQHDLLVQSAANAAFGEWIPANLHLPSYNTSLGKVSSFWWLNYERKSSLTVIGTCISCRSSSRWKALLACWYCHFTEILMHHDHIIDQYCWSLFPLTARWGAAGCFVAISMAGIFHAIRLICHRGIIFLGRTTQQDLGAACGSMDKLWEFHQNDKRLHII